WSPHQRHPLGGRSWSPISFELATRVARQLIDLIAQAQQRRDPQEIGYTDFAALQPPIFTVATDPLDADDRLRIIVSKFSLSPQLTEQRRLASRHGVYMCASFPAMQPAGHQVTWDEFRAAFRAHYLPPSLIELKQREFRALRQGNMSVLEYVQAFIRPSQYSPKMSTPTHVGLPVRWMDLIPPRSTHLGRGYDGFTELVDVAIDMEDRLNHAHEDRRRKRLASTLRSGSSRRQRVVLHRSPLIHYIDMPRQQEPHRGTQQPSSCKCTTSSAYFGATGQTKCQIPLLQLWKDRPFQQELFCPTAKLCTIVD
ncbi:hypothetical protein U9M48_035785, partial [Paspalum notatum var. saurae]